MTLLDKNFIADQEHSQNNDKYIIKIQDSLKGFDLSLCIIIKKTVDNKLKFIVRAKQHKLSELDKEKVIQFIKREICSVIFGNFI